MAENKGIKSISSSQPECAKLFDDLLVVRTDRYGYHKARSRAVSAGPLTPEVITAHVHARTRADVIGGLTVVEVDGVCYGKETALDIDAHRRTPEQITANEAAAVAWYNVLVGLGYDPLLTTEGRAATTFARSTS